jgi:hypothetical protein
MYKAQSRMKHEFTETNMQEQAKIRVNKQNSQIKQMQEQERKKKSE